MLHSKKPLALALGTAFALTGMAASSASFAAQDLSAGYMVASADDTKAGEHHCGEAKCGADKKAKKAKKAAEKNCGGEKKAGEKSCGGEKKAAEKNCGGEKKAAEKSCGGDKAAAPAPAAK